MEGNWFRQVRNILFTSGIVCLLYSIIKLIFHDLNPTLEPYEKIIQSRSDWVVQTIFFSIKLFLPMTIVMGAFIFLKAKLLRANKINIFTNICYYLVLSIILVPFINYFHGEGFKYLWFSEIDINRYLDLVSICSVLFFAIIFETIEKFRR
jgi:hypothetical protein